MARKQDYSSNDNYDGVWQCIGICVVKEHPGSTVIAEIDNCDVPAEYKMLKWYWQSTSMDKTKVCFGRNTNSTCKKIRMK